MFRLQYSLMLESRTALKKMTFNEEPRKHTGNEGERCSLREQKPR